MNVREFVNNLLLCWITFKEKVQSGILNLGLSDHCAVFCTRKLSRGQINRHNTVKLRSMKSYDVSEFQTKLNEADWSGVTCS